MGAEGHEQLVMVSDAGSGLKAIIAIHDTTLGPACGGTRIWPYESEQEAIADALRLVVCVTETYNRKNVGLTVDESAALFAEIVVAARTAGVPVSVVLAVAFGCPFEGEVPEERVLDLARRFVDLGSEALGIADSAGLAQPLQVRALIGRLRREVEGTPLWLHLHDTRGLGLANALAAMEQGVDTFATSLGGMGGCPIMKGASGNIASEDFVYMCHEMGLETGVDLGALRAASRRMETFLERALPSRVLAAGTREELVARNR